MMAKSIHGQNVQLIKKIKKFMGICVFALNFDHCDNLMTRDFTNDHTSRIKSVF